MSQSDPRALRLALACPEPPPGPVAVFGPRAGDDLSALGPDLRIVTGFRPDHDFFAGHGHRCGTALTGRCATAVVCLPRAREAARDLVARAVALTDGAVLVDGQKTDGIDALLRACRARTAVADPVVKAHGKLFRLEAARPEEFADWEAAPRRLPGGFVTRAGVFSADGPDPGSQLLAAALPERLPARVADLGGGWGWLAAQILARDGVETLDLVEADHAALDCARANLRDPRLRFHWADVTRFAPEAPFDAVVMNPPFHAGRTADPALGAAFIAAAARMLAPQGRLWLVANRQLPYEAALQAAFREVEALPGSGAFKLLAARTPRTAAGRGHHRSRQGHPA